MIDSEVCKGLQSPEFPPRAYIPRTSRAPKTFFTFGSLILCPFLVWFTSALFILFWSQP